jgi:hypothetical protein
VKANNCFYFPASVEVSESGAHNSEKYSNCIRAFIEEFYDTFSNFKVREI